MHQRALAKVDLFVPVAALTTTTQGSGIDIGDPYTNVARRECMVVVSVGAGGLSGSPTLDWAVQQNTTSGATGFANIATGTQITTAATQVLFCLPTQRYMRVIYTMGATTSITVNAFVFLEKRFP